MSPGVHIDRVFWFQTQPTVSQRHRPGSNPSGHHERPWTRWPNPDRLLTLQFRNHGHISRTGSFWDLLSTTCWPALIARPGRWVDDFPCRVPTMSESKTRYHPPHAVAFQVPVKRLWSPTGLGDGLGDAWASMTHRDIGGARGRTGTVLGRVVTCHLCQEPSFISPSNESPAS